MGWRMAKTVGVRSATGCANRRSHERASGAGDLRAQRVQIPSMEAAGVFRLLHALRILRCGSLGETLVGPGEGLFLGRQFLGEDLAAQGIALRLAGGRDTQVGGRCGDGGAQKRQRRPRSDYLSGSSRMSNVSGSVHGLPP
jgi:hypothetical protein